MSVTHTRKKLPGMVLSANSLRSGLGLRSLHMFGQVVDCSDRSNGRLQDTCLLLRGVRDAMDELDRRPSDVESRVPALEGRVDGVEWRVEMECAYGFAWPEARDCRMAWAVWRAVSWRGLSVPRPSLRKYAKLWVEKSMKRSQGAEFVDRSRRLRPGNAFNIQLVQGEPSEPLRNRYVRALTGCFSSCRSWRVRTIPRCK